MSVRGGSERLRETFVDVLRAQVMEARELASAADPDVREAAGQVLDGAAGTARSLGLDDLVRVTAAAAAAVRGGAGSGAFAEVLACCRALDTTPMALRPLLLLEGEGLANTTHDSYVRRLATLAALRFAASERRALAAVVPNAVLEAAVDIPELAGVPVYAYGAESRRADASGAGASGYFATPVDARTLPTRVRAWVLAGTGSDRVLLVGATETQVRTWSAALGEVETAPSGRLLARMAEVDPCLVVLAGADARDLSEVLRCHPDWWTVSRVVVGAPAGPDLSLPAKPPDRVAGQLVALRRRAVEERALRMADPGGVLSAFALLRAVERHTAAARRARAPLTVARVEIDEPGALRAARGPLAVEAAIRVLERVIAETVRDTDEVGRVGVAGFGLILPGTTAEVVRDRMDQIVARFAAAAASRPGLEGVVVSVGLADTAEGDAELFARAERDRNVGRR